MQDLTIWPPQVGAKLQLGPNFSLGRVKTLSSPQPSLPIQKERYKDIKAFLPLDTDSESLLRMALTELNLSARAYDRILKVSRTIADLASAEKVDSTHLSEAIQYRTLDRQVWG